MRIYDRWILKLLEADLRPQWIVLLAKKEGT